MSQELAEHLRYFQELGVTGISRDPAWTRRALDAGAIAGRSDDAGAPVTIEPAPAHQPALSAAAVPEPSAAPVGAASHQVLIELKHEIGPACTRCKLHTLGRKQIVFGVGNPAADLMFVGEAPGADEDIQGEPFVGRAGQLLTKIIEAIGLQRSDVYIANVIKCRPPGNRNPELDEVEQCEPFLFRQIDAIKPKVIVALGKFAAQSLLKTADPITRLRGRAFTYRGATLIPTFHPAYLLRNPSSKREVWEDMKKVRAILQGDA
jgi:DNA polymerase